MAAPHGPTLHLQVYRRRGTVEGRGPYLHRHEVHSLFDELIHRPWAAVRWRPPVDVRESDDAFLLELDLPGVKAEDTEIRAQEKTLTIEGQRALRPCDETTSHVCERPDGRFVRTFEFAETIEDREIQSRWQDGVLTVTVPKSKHE
ncbi:MAG: hypothetical protein A2Y76_05450 [Planctomycetes bacterium RBG_13_60_9]|nr:MAG: hypothetical protein A2Y76_05450 [Planctomycetes bacterium RBG_13_60_9]